MYDNELNFRNHRQCGSWSSSSAICGALSLRKILCAALAPCRSNSHGSHLIGAQLCGLPAFLLNAPPLPIISFSPLPFSYESFPFAPSTCAYDLPGIRCLASLPLLALNVWSKAWSIVLAIILEETLAFWLASEEAKNQVRTTFLALLQGATSFQMVFP